VRVLARLLRALRLPSTLPLPLLLLLLLDDEARDAAHILVHELLDRLARLLVLPRGALALARRRRRRLLRALGVPPLEPLALARRRRLGPSVELGQPVRLARLVGVRVRVSVSVSVRGRARVRFRVRFGFG
jgi:hypothetical protein